MRRHIILLIASITIGLLGCQSKPVPPPAPIEEQVEAVSPENADSVRATYKAQYPDSQVGVVVAAINHKNGHFVAAGGVDLSKMENGQIVTFIDSKQRPVATGFIVNVLPDQVHARVDEPTIRRKPQVGDMMVRF
jgi:hypothetical protein